MITCGPHMCWFVVAGSYINQWRVGLYVNRESVPGHRLRILASLQGQASDGTWLPPVRVLPEDKHYMVHPAEGSEGFAHLDGMDGGWGMGSMHKPIVSARKASARKWWKPMQRPWALFWRVDADQLGVPQGRVVGYQMYHDNPFSSMRFLFRPFQDSDPEGKQRCPSHDDRLSESCWSGGLGDNQHANPRTAATVTAQCLTLCHSGWTAWCTQPHRTGSVGTTKTSTAERGMVAISCRNVAMLVSCVSSNASV
jgi:hypothetical protein